MMTAITVATQTSTGKQEGGGGEGQRDEDQIAVRSVNTDSGFIRSITVSGRYSTKMTKLDQESHINRLLHH